MLPTSIPLRRITGWPQTGQASPSRALSMSVITSAWKSRPTLTLRRWHANPVGPGDQVRRTGRELIDDDERVVGTDGRAVAGFHPCRVDLVDGSRPQATGNLGRVAQLRLVHVAVAPHDRGDQAAVAGHEEGGLGGCRRVDPEERGECRRSSSRRASRLPRSAARVTIRRPAGGPLPPGGWPRSRTTRTGREGPRRPGSGP